MAPQLTQRRDVSCARTQPAPRVTATRHRKVRLPRWRTPEVRAAAVMIASEGPGAPSRPIPGWRVS
eukprot:7391059-Prymnesium_polylepis.1